MKFTAVLSLFLAAFAAAEVPNQAHHPDKRADDLVRPPPPPGNPDHGHGSHSSHSSHHAPSSHSRTHHPTGTGFPFPVGTGGPGSKPWDIKPGQKLRDGDHNGRHHGSSSGFETHTVYSTGHHHHSGGPYPTGSVHTWPTGTGQAHPTGSGKPWSGRPGPEPVTVV